MNVLPTQTPIYDAGFAAGTAAGGWVEISDVDAARTLLAGYEDGDPEVMDLQPSPLSGEWAGESLAELGLADASDDELCAYEDGYCQGFWAEVVRRCEYQLPRVDLDLMFAAYVECAVWAGSDWSSDSDGNPTPLEATGYSADDVAEETAVAMRADVEAFAAANAGDLAGMDSGQAGHDFFLTRNHHGAGFWDRGLGEIGDRLTAAAHAYGESDLFVGDDGQLYV